MKTDIEKCIEKICDDYCKFPCVIKDVECLEKICAECPMNEIVNILQI